MLDKTKWVTGQSYTPIDHGPEGDLYARGTTVLSRDAKLSGLTTGGTRRCQLEGCRGHRIGVRWSDGRITWPCSGGLYVQRGKWKIQ